MDEPSDSDWVYCHACGEEIGSDARFCRYCGASNPLASEESSQSRSNRSARNPGTESGTPGAGRGSADTDDSYHWEDRTQTEAVKSEEVGPDRQLPGEQPADSRWGGRIGRPSRDESPLRSVLVAGGLGVLGVGILLIVSVFVLGFSGLVGAPDLVVLTAGTVVGQYVGFVGLSVAYLNRRGFDWSGIRSYIGVRVPTLREIGIVVLGYVAIFASIMIVGGLIEAFAPTEPADNQSTEALSGSTNPLIAVGAIVMMFLVVGPCEETLFRGVVQNRIRERLSVAPGILIASVIFALVHLVALAPDSLTAQLLTVGILFFPALVLGTVYEYTGNVVVSSLLHSIHNSIVVLVVFFSGELEGAGEILAAVGGLPDVVVFLLTLGPG